jgi:hypothetical protein
MCTGRVLYEGAKKRIFVWEKKYKLKHTIIKPPSNYSYCPERPPMSELQRSDVSMKAQNTGD